MTSEITTGDIAAGDFTGDGKADVASSWDSDGLMARIIRIARDAAPEMVVISDNCFCEYTDHGHCGVIKDNDVDNDETLKLLAAEALSHLNRIYKLAVTASDVGLVPDGSWVRFARRRRISYCMTSGSWQHDLNNSIFDQQEQHNASQLDS